MLDKTFLSIDTSMGACSVGVASQDSVVSMIEPMKHGQAERLVPMVQEALARAKVSYEQLDAIITTMGPGAFTGLRVGMSSAKAFGVALNTPVFGLSSLQAMAFRYSDETKAQQPFCVVIDTRRDDFYIQGFASNAQPHYEPEVINVEGFGERYAEEYSVFIGDGVEKLSLAAQNLNLPARSEYLYCDPLVNAKMFTLYPHLFQEKPDALYLRGADVSQSKQVFRKIKA